MAESPTLIRNFFNEDLVLLMGKTINKAYPKFDSAQFKKHCLPFTDEEAFKDRSNKITKALIETLPQDFKKSIAILLSTFPKEDTNEDINWSSFYYMPIGTFVELQGCEKEYLKEALNALYEITKRFTSEFAIRAFILKFPEETFEYLKEWVHDSNQHVRRLVSEGTRPRLPWAQALPKFKKDPTQTLALLEVLQNDSSKYVQKSVANHLNDITKDNPKRAIETLARWKKENNPNTNWIIKHALRSELKKGTPEALEILGFSSKSKIEVANLKLSSEKVKVGESLAFSFDIISKENKEVPVMIDYNIHYQKANGKTAPKTFKLAVKDIKANQTLSFKKKQSFKIISTRKFHLGQHAVEIQINGNLLEKVYFELVD